MLIATLLLQILNCLGFTSAQSNRPGEFYSAQGTEFSFFVPYNQATRATGSNSRIEISITTWETSTVRAELFLPLITHIQSHYNVTLTRDNPATIQLPIDVMHYGSRISNRGILVLSSKDVAVHVLCSHQFSVGAFAVSPAHLLGFTYSVITAQASASCPVFIGIMAVESGDTTVIITWPNKSGIKVSYEGSIRRGGSMVVALKQYQTLQLLHVDIISGGDLSGAQIMSANRLFVVSGNSRASLSLSGNTKSSDYIVDQVPAKDAWEKVKVYPIPHRNAPDDHFDILKVICLSRNNIVIGSESYTCDGSLEIPVLASEPSVLRAREGVMVARITSSQRTPTANYKTDPAMAILIPEEQFSTRCYINTFNVTSDLLYDFYELTIITRETYREQITINGERLTNLTEAKEIEGSETRQGVSLLSMVINIPSGIHMIETVNDGSIQDEPTLMCMITARCDREAYSYVVNRRIWKPFKDCAKSLGSPGDGIDNDCDREVDEDICTDEGSKSVVPEVGNISYKTRDCK